MALWVWTQRNKVLKTKGNRTIGSSNKRPISSSFMRFAPDYQPSFASESLRRMPISKPPRPSQNNGYDASLYMNSASYDANSLRSAPREFKASRSANTFIPSVCLGLPSLSLKAQLNSAPTQNQFADTSYSTFKGRNHPRKTRDQYRISKPSAKIAPSSVNDNHGSLYTIPTQNNMIKINSPETKLRSTTRIQSLETRIEVPLPSNGSLYSSYGRSSILSSRPMQQSKIKGESSSFNYVARYEPATIVHRDYKPPSSDDELYTTSSATSYSS